MKTLFHTLAFLTGLLITSATAQSADFMYRDLMANTLPPQRCLDKSAAEANAQDPYLVERKEKVFCETQGYGWHMASEKDSGKLVCQECAGDNNKGKFQCHKEDIVVACKRLKPGSVGLVPGEG